MTSLSSTAAVAEREKDELMGNQLIAYAPGLSIPPHGLAFWLDSPSHNGITFNKFSDPGATDPTSWIDTKNGYAAFS